MTPSMEFVLFLPCLTMSNKVPSSIPLTGIPSTLLQLPKTRMESTNVRNMVPQVRPTRVISCHCAVTDPR